MLFPTTRLGKLACWLALAFLGLLILDQVLLSVRQAEPSGFALAVLTGLSWLAFGAALAAAGVALAAIVRHRERALPVWLSLLPGLLVLLFLLTR